MDHPPSTTELAAPGRDGPCSPPPPRSPRSPCPHRPRRRRRWRGSSVPALSAESPTVARALPGRTLDGCRSQAGALRCQIDGPPAIVADACPRRRTGSPAPAGASAPPTTAAPAAATTAPPAPAPPLLPPPRRRPSARPERSRHLGPARPVRGRRQLGHQHRQRLLRRPPVLGLHVALRRRHRPPPRAQPRDPDRDGQAPPGPGRLEPVAQLHPPPRLPLTAHAQRQATISPADGHQRPTGRGRQSRRPRPPPPRPPVVTDRSAGRVARRG